MNVTEFKELSSAFQRQPNQATLDSLAAAAQSSDEFRSSAALTIIAVVGRHARASQLHAWEKLDLSLALPLLVELVETTRWSVVVLRVAMAAQLLESRTLLSACEARIEAGGFARSEDDTI